MKQLALILIVMCLGFSTALAGFVDGYTLAANWKEAQKQSEGRPFSTDDARFYHGYVLGVVDSLDQVDGFFNIPTNVKGGQLFAVVGKYIDEHPANWNYPAYLLVVEALKEAFPVVLPVTKTPPNPSKNPLDR